VVAERGLEERSRETEGDPGDERRLAAGQAQVLDDQQVEAGTDAEESRQGPRRGDAGHAKPEGDDQQRQAGHRTDHGDRGGTTPTAVADGAGGQHGGHRPLPRRPRATAMRTGAPMMAATTPASSSAERTRRPTTSAVSSISGP